MSPGSRWFYENRPSTRTVGSDRRQRKTGKNKKNQVRKSWHRHSPKEKISRAKMHIEFFFRALRFPGPRTSFFRKIFFFQVFHTWPFSSTCFWNFQNWMVLFDHMGVRRRKKWRTSSKGLCGRIFHSRTNVMSPTSPSKSTISKKIEFDPKNAKKQFWPRWRFLGTVLRFFEVEKKRGPRAQKKKHFFQKKKKSLI